MGLSPYEKSIVLFVAADKAKNTHFFLFYVCLLEDYIASSFLCLWGNFQIKFWVRLIQKEALDARIAEARNLVLAFKKNHYYIFYYLSETQQKNGGISQKGSQVRGGSDVG